MAGADSEEVEQTERRGGRWNPPSRCAHEAVAARRRIAAEICALVADGESVLLDSGTTCLEGARLLREQPVTVMPLSLQAVHLPGETPGPATLVVPGGQPRAAEGALTGSLTLASLAALRFDTATVGCCGLSAADGLTAYDLDDAAVKKAGIASARRVIAAADSSKLGRTASAHVAPGNGRRSGLGFRLYAAGVGPTQDCINVHRCV
nr:hypothetical protein [Streptomyces sp. Act143]